MLCDGLTLYHSYCVSGFYEKCGHEYKGIQMAKYY